MATNSKELYKRHQEMKKKHPDAIVLMRVGDFYETFDEDAESVSEILGITLTKRNLDEFGEIRLAGFPHHTLDTYLPKLVRAGKRMAICEQLEDPKLAKKPVKRGDTEQEATSTEPLKVFISKRSKNLFGLAEKSNRYKDIVIEDDGERQSVWATNARIIAISRMKYVTLDGSRELAVSDDFSPHNKPANRQFKINYKDFKNLVKSLPDDSYIYIRPNGSGSFEVSASSDFSGDKYNVAEQDRKKQMQCLWTILENAKSFVGLKAEGKWASMDYYEPSAECTGMLLDEVKKFNPNKNDKDADIYLFAHAKDIPVFDTERQSAPTGMVPYASRKVPAGKLQPMVLKASVVQILERIGELDKRKSFCATSGIGGLVAINGGTEGWLVLTMNYYGMNSDAYNRHAKKFAYPETMLGMTIDGIRLASWHDGSGFPATSEDGGEAIECEYHVDAPENIMALIEDDLEECFPEQGDIESLEDGRKRWVIKTSENSAREVLLKLVELIGMELY